MPTLRAMKSNDTSSLRQLIDMLGAQLANPDEFDAALVIAICNKLSFAASDRKTPLPDDIFAPGINEMLMRVALGQLAITIARMAQQSVSKPPKS